MKKIKYSNIKNARSNNTSSIGFIPNDNVYVPVFETEAEFITYNYYAQDEERQKMIKDYFETADQEEKDYYGEEVVLKNCEKMVDREIRAMQKKAQNKMMEKADELDIDKFYAILHSRYVGHGDYTFLNDGLFTSEEVAKTCFDLLNEREPDQYYIVDNEGNEIGSENGAEL